MEIKELVSMLVSGQQVLLLLLAVGVSEERGV